MVDNRLAWALNNTRANLAPPFITSVGQATMQVGTGQGALFSRTPVMAKVIDTLDPATATRDEDLLVTARSGDTLTIQRGFYGRAPQTFASGGTVWVLNAAETINRLVTATQRAAGTVDVSQLATGGSGTRAAPWTGWDAAIAAAYTPTLDEAHVDAGRHFYFPPGYFAQTVMLDMGIGWVLRGAGPLASRIIATPAGGMPIAQVRCRNNPAGAPLNQRGGVFGLYLEQALTGTSGANIDLTNVAYFRCENVSLIGGKYGLIWDMAEHCSLVDFDTGFHQTAGVWLVKGTEHDAAASPFAFTNQNVITRGNINEPRGACAGIAHDGGQANRIDAVGFNACLTAIHLAAAETCLIESCYLEGGGNSRIILAAVSFAGVAKAGNFEVAVKQNWINAGTAGASCIEGKVNAGSLHSEGNFFHTLGGYSIRGVANFNSLQTKDDTLDPASGAFLLDATPPKGAVLGDPDGHGIRWGIGISTSDFGSGGGVLALAPATTVPTTNGIANGGILYVSGGNLYYRSSAGNVRLVAAV